MTLGGSLCNMAKVEIKVTDKGIVKEQKFLDEENNPIKFSAWFITVNSNQIPRSVEHVQKVSELLKNEFISMVQDDLDKIIKVKKKGHKAEPPYLRKVNVDITAEVGSNKKGGRIHIHAFVEFEHQSKIQLNYNAVNQILRERLVGPGKIEKDIWVGIKLTRSSKSIEAYLTKDPIENLIRKMKNVELSSSK